MFLFLRSFLPKNWAISTDKIYIFPILLGRPIDPDSSVALQNFLCYLGLFYDRDDNRTTLICNRTKSEKFNYRDFVMMSCTMPVGSLIVLALSFRVCKRVILTPSGINGCENTLSF